MSLWKTVFLTLASLWCVQGAACAQGEHTQAEMDGATMNNAGIKLLNQGDNAGAEAFFRKAIYNLPNHKSPNYGLGKALMNQGKYSEAIAPLKRACDLDPKNVNYKTKLARCYSESGDYRTSSYMLEKLLLEPLSPDEKYDTIKNLSFDYTRLRNYKSAAEMQKQLVSLDPKNSDCLFYQALYLEKAGLFPEARQTYTAFLSRFPGDKHEVEVKKALAKVMNQSTAARASYIGRWASMPISVCVVAPSTTLKGYKPNFQAVVGRALKTWQDSSKGLVSFQFVAAPENAQIVVSFTDDVSTLKGDHMGKTILTFDEKTRVISKAKMLLSTLNFRDNNAPFNELSIEALALHEIGDALGLPHSGNQKDAMFPSGQNNGIELTALSANDVLWLTNLYTYKKTPAVGGSTKAK